MIKETSKTIFYLADLKNKNDFKKLFIEQWNWDPPRISSPIIDFPDEIKTKIKESEILAERGAYQIFLFILKEINFDSREFKVIENKILRNSDLRPMLENAVFIFSSEDFDYTDFVRAEKTSQKIRIKRFSINPENRSKLRTPSEQLSKLKLDLNDLNQPAKVNSYIKNKIQEAFSVDVVTESFFNDYIEIFKKIEKSLTNQKVDVLEKEKNNKLKDFIHQLLDRMMFLYFVQKRGCFGNDKNFLAHFWDAYKTDFQGENKFQEDWLNVLFFDVLSTPSWMYKDRDYLKDFNSILKTAPYFNGGLFEKNDLDKIGWKISDDLFEDLFSFLESYNFTIEESTPFEIDIAINPEMLGNIYEHLVNIEEVEEQSKAGIFYTPKVEIELMLRKSLVEFLFNKTQIDKKKLYEFIFPELGTEIKENFNNEESENLLKELDNIFILDPACGSGHYLVVAVQLLYQLKEILWENLGIKHLGCYQEKKQIIERNIYGNDIKAWAVSISKLRLWLDLFVYAEEDVLKDQTNPILPSLNFKIRVGDSIVQRIGHQLVPLRRLQHLVSNRAKDLKILIQKKQYIYKTGDNEEYKNTLYLEKKLLLDIIAEMQIETKQQIQKKNADLKKIQNNLFMDNSKEISEILSTNQIKEEVESLTQKYKELIEMENELIKMKEPPMIWDLAFAEVFAEKKGFDIVIANPPYVRQEKIDDLNGFYSRKEYKDKLIRQIFLDWSYNFEGNIINESTIPKKFDKRCDLYVYFYLKGLKLLNPEGIFCYISSNSWLDVGYGKILQEILIKSVPIIGIYDNLVKRSFKHADINTIIAILKAPKNRDCEKEIQENEVSFVMFKRPFEEIMCSEIFIELEKEDGFNKYPEGKRKETDIFRIHKINQNELYEFGKDQKTGTYIGNKWGGKYLRAPEIYFKILEKGKDKLVKLGDVADVRFGIKTGANEFFYLKPVDRTVKEVVEIAEKNPQALIRVKNSAGWEGEIEAEFLKPVIKSPRELKTIIVKIEDLNYLVFMCHKSKKELKGKKALEYIEWGEKEKFNTRPTCKSRNMWWNLDGFVISFTRGLFINSRFITSLNNKAKAFVDANLIMPIPKPNLDLNNVAHFLNSTIGNLMLELGGRVSLGEGVLKIQNYEYEDIIVLDPALLLKYPNLYNVFRSIFVELGFNPQKPIRKQEPKPLPDRKELDDTVFDALGLTEDERKEVYWAVAELVQNRLNKAQSV